MSFAAGQYTFARLVTAELRSVRQGHGAVAPCILERAGAADYRRTMPPSWFAARRWPARGRPHRRTDAVPRLLPDDVRRRACRRAIPGTQDGEACRPTSTP